MSIIRLENLLKPSAGGRLGKIIRTAQSMQDLTARLRSVLEPDAAANLIAASLRDDGELVLVCSSSAWASRLRFESEALLTCAKRAGAAATHCRVRVAHDSGAD